MISAVRDTVYRPESQNFVAVFQKDDGQPAFLMSVDLATRRLTIRAVTADRQVGKAYQLWIVADQLGPAPRSLGLLNATLEPTHRSLAEFGPAILQNATFGISVEPLGGSPTGRPTGPALHGKLYPATP
jgi:anti-sigma-K factor RskA